MDLNKTITIINEASEATEVLQNEFYILVNEVETPIKEEIHEINTSTPQLITTSPLMETNNTVETNNTIPLKTEEIFEINESIAFNNTTIINTEKFERNESIELNSTITTSELNMSKKLSCNENNSTVVINGLSINLDANNSVIDNGCTDANLGTSARGLIIFKTRIKPYCNISGETFAKQYMQEDWDDIYHEKELKMEVIKACPKVKKRYKDKWTPHLYQFSLEYASDSDAIPEC
jgi:hypothetical protein